MLLSRSLLTLSRTLAQDDRENEEERKLLSQFQASVTGQRYHEVSARRSVPAI